MTKIQRKEKMDWFLENNPKAVELSDKYGLCCVWACSDDKAFTIRFDWLTATEADAILEAAQSLGLIDAIRKREREE